MHAEFPQTHVASRYVPAATLKGWVRAAKTYAMTSHRGGTAGCARHPSYRLADLSAVIDGALGALKGDL